MLTKRPRRGQEREIQTSGCNLAPAMLYFIKSMIPLTLRHNYEEDKLLRISAVSIILTSYDKISVNHLLKHTLCLLPSEPSFEFYQSDNHN